MEHNWSEIYQKIQPYIESTRDDASTIFLIVGTILSCLVILNVVIIYALKKYMNKRNAEEGRGTFDRAILLSLILPTIVSIVIFVAIFGPAYAVFDPPYLVEGVVISKYMDEDNQNVPLVVLEIKEKVYFEKAGIKKKEKVTEAITFVVVRLGFYKLKVNEKALFVAHHNVLLGRISEDEFVNFMR